MKSRRDRRSMQHKWEEKEMYTEFLWGILRERHHLEDLRVDRRIILKLVFKKWNGGHSLNLFGSGWGWVVGSVESGTEPPGSITWKDSWLTENLLVFQGGLGSMKTDR
jgi:hypothetical protein